MLVSAWKKIIKNTDQLNAFVSNQLSAFLTFSKCYCWFVKYKDYCIKYHDQQATKTTSKEARINFRHFILRKI